ncbi:MAG TPA: outer membrane beta-barrel protein [Nitrospira sp.]|nr:outer membrane beta-barrel protein [Nitrospira sp.]
MTAPAFGQEPPDTTGPEEHRKGEIGGPTSQAQQQPPDWHYGGFVDLGYSLDFNFPANHLFRNHNTTPRVNELDLNMAGVYVKKDATMDSRWGMELMGQAGQDALNFAFGTNLPRVAGADALRHFGRANLSYLAPVGTGLTFQAGLFNSFIGYESLYAKDNFNYTRAWIADYSPYLMFGANAQYNFDDKWSGVFFIINEYVHLQNANSLPSYGAQVAYKPNRSWLFKETVYYGPDQSDTSLEFWRFFSDSIAEWKVNDDVTLVGEYQIGTQVMAMPGNPRFMYMGAAFPMRWHISGPWSVALRPEFYYDPNGFQTGAEQFIRAVTTTAEYKFPYKWTNLIGRLEYRYDESTGSGGGFFKGNEIAPGVVGLTPAQHMLIFALIWTLDSP